ncbi:hypothetical protein HMPREF9629_01283 [Peptoanaerobacter stomatis]|uniref:CRISPR type III-associated protein domain-containing protein n=1 Tax=Peptoanaerobacter stomatis TaxID=796937 RepID=G9WYN2_9FIRM|nr:RAMP superfamily CRISPR-associated protein [Peptoanaerobacter stomatis]EHL16443.1 hypothetical protein HMPREF9629_01283 [Peptoanaerobacter stomatis]
MKLKFKTISPIILSSRTEKALYKDVDFKEVTLDKMSFEDIDVQNIKIIYPFYGYESRDLLPEKNFSTAKEYYIPASSLKGALLGNKKSDEENSLRRKILFQDVKINYSHIKLRNIYKFQYLYQEDKEEIQNQGNQAKNANQANKYKTPKYDVFFPSVAIEMMKIGNEFECEILLKEPITSEEFFKKKLDENFNITQNKLKNYVKEIENRMQEIKSWIKKKELEKPEDNDENYIEKLQTIENNINELLNSNKKMIFLGGYKGILASLSKFDENTKVQNSFYIDNETLLPYGLIEIN